MPMPRPKRHAFIAALVLAVTLSGCAGMQNVSGYPSLAPRPIEQRVAAGTAEPAGPPMPAPVSATLVQAIAALGQDADAGEAAFRTALSDLGDIVRAGRGAATGSEAWAQAQAALSRIIIARAPTTLALTELDRLALTQADAAGGSVPTDLAAQQARVAALAAGQDAVLAGLE